MIPSEHALTGNGDKLVKGFLSILEYATSWLDIRECFEWGWQTDSFSSFIVSVRQPVSYSFACHVSCKVKYYWKVANVKVRLRGGDNVLSFSHLCRSMSPTNQLSAVDHCGSRTQSMKSCHEETNRSFSLSRNKKINWKPSSGRSQENEMF